MTKPQKPTPDFPLFPHATKRWAKKIRGKMHYFGPWDDPAGALANYKDQAEALHAGRTPRGEGNAATVKEVANEFLNHKDALVKTGEIKKRTWLDLKETCDLVVSIFGKGRLVEDLGPDDFAKLRERMARRWGVLRLLNFVQRVRSLFKFAHDNRIIPAPVCFGSQFKRPSKKTVRLNRAAAGQKLFTAGEVRKLIDAASVQFRAMLLLGVNCGMGNSDCARLPLSALDLENGWLDFPRPKTGIARRCHLWPETVAALKDALAERRRQREGDAGDALVFITIYGSAWEQEENTGPVPQAFSRLKDDVGMTAREGLGFYTLRHTFRTVADGAKDQPAANRIMGHEVPHMSSIYREGISDERLRAVSEHVRGWLYAD
jgi:integrase